MNIKLFIIDEPIFITNNEQICNLWQKSLWSKVQSYKLYYKNKMLKVGADDFFGSHLIAAKEYDNGELEPIIMLKSVRLSKYKYYKNQFPLQKLLRNSSLDNFELIGKLLKSEKEISYHSSFTVNPKYHDHPERIFFKDLITVLLYNYYNKFQIDQWVAIAALKFKVDKYLSSMGACPIHSQFVVEESDFEPVQLFFNQDTSLGNLYIARIIKKYKELSDSIEIYKPDNPIVKEFKLNKVS